MREIIYSILFVLLMERCFKLTLFQHKYEVFCVFILLNAEHVCSSMKECVVESKRGLTQCCDWENGGDSSDEGRLIEQWRLWWLRLGGMWVRGGL